MQFRHVPRVSFVPIISEHIIYDIEPNTSETKRFRRIIISRNQSAMVEKFSSKLINLVIANEGQKFIYHHRAF